MNCLDLTLPTPAENLAADEALLDTSEANGGPGLLRFWEPKEYFVVVGYANHVAVEVNQPKCEADSISIFRRCSGGGTVLQGPGCLNYSLILKIEEGGSLENITSANKFIMERNRAAIETLIRSSRREQTQVAKPGTSQSLVTSAAAKVEVRGHTDLALDGVKSSGNAQRRKKHFLLFHGTFLLHFDLALVEKYLRMPSKQPDYRQSRTHKDFLTNLEVSAESVKRTLQEAWCASEPLKVIPNATIASLARDKYATNEWNFKF
jgi:lipoate-protein ligase A